MQHHSNHMVRRSKHNREIITQLFLKTVKNSHPGPIGCTLDGFYMVWHGINKECTHYHGEVFWFYCQIGIYILSPNVYKV